VVCISTLSFHAILKPPDNGAAPISLTIDRIARIGEGA
jgi:hypothetical protein